MKLAAIAIFQSHDRKRQNMPTSSLNNTMTMVSGVSVLVSAFWPPLATGWLDTAHLFLAACLWLGQEQEASSQKPSQGPDT